MGFKDTLEQDINRFSVASNSKGDIALVTSWKKLGGSTTVKPNVYFYRSGDNGLTWSGPQRLNRNQCDNTSSYFPDMHMKDDGTIFVAWQDHRYIRGNISINYSKDAGKTWLEKDIIIETLPGKNNDHFPYVVHGGETYYILWSRFSDDSMKGRNLFMEEYRLK
jgi:Neuraminidase (sialidase)